MDVNQIGGVPPLRRAGAPGTVHGRNAVAAGMVRPLCAAGFRLQGRWRSCVSSACFRGFCAATCCTASWNSAYFRCLVPWFPTRCRALRRRPIARLRGVLLAGHYLMFVGAAATAVSMYRSHILPGMGGSFLRALSGTARVEIATAFCSRNGSGVFDGALSFHGCARVCGSMVNRRATADGGGNPVKSSSYLPRRLAACRAISSSPREEASLWIAARAGSAFESPFLRSTSAFVSRAFKCVGTNPCSDAT